MRVESRSWSAFRGWQASAWVRFACLLPLLFGVIAKLRHPDGLFSEYRTVACAGIHANAGEAFYSRTLSCDGRHVPSFVYLPDIARIAGRVIAVIGEPGFLLIYLCLTIASVAALISIPLFAAVVPGRWADRLPFASLVAGGAVLVGNIAVILHGAILVAALVFETAPWVLIGVVVVASWIKPVFLTALAIPLIADMPWRRKAVMIGTGAVVGLLPTVIFAMSGGPLAQQWLDLLSYFVCDVTPGKGLLGWLQWFGINGRSPVAQLVWLGFAAALVGCGAVLPKALRLSSAERIWLGLSIATLLIPRIMAEDVFLIGPGLLAVARGAGRLLPVSDVFEAPVLKNGVTILHGLCVLALAGGLSDLGDVAVSVALLGFSLYLFFVGQIAARQVLAAVMPQFVASKLRAIAE
ncbi:MAG: hypothetical protein JF571_05950 [Asticcacaulis sp.]|nr:hypothetical protein [Asticcacaulis sp.]